MFCPDCGTDNSKNQKFCTRCGSNLMAIDRLRDVIGNVTSTTGGLKNQLNPMTVLKIVAVIATLGMGVVTAGTIFLALIDSGTPMPVFFGLSGLIATVLICRYLVRMVQSAVTADKPQPVGIPSQTPVVTGRVATDRRLDDAAVPYQSITEERTRQFEGDR
jgi:hypothetical protein